MSRDFPAGRSVIFFLAILMSAALAHELLYRMPFEDAFITFRYVRNLLDGHGLVFNPGGERVEGFTCFAWVVFLAGVSLTGLDIPAAAGLLSLLSGLGLVLLTLSMSRKWIGTYGFWWMVPAVLLAANGTWAYYSMTGMESSLFALLINLAVFSLISSRPGFTVAAGVIFAVSAMIRPEGAGYFLAVLAALVTTKTRRKDILCFTGMFLLIFVPYFLWRFSYFGYPLPNTFYAKATLSTGRLLWGIEYLEQFMTLRLFWFVPVCMWIMFRRRGSDDLLRLASFMLAAAVIDVVIVGGDQFPFYRFFLPVMPLCLVVLVIGVVELTEFLKKRRNWPGARATTVAALVLTLYAVWTFAGSFLPVVTFSTDTGISHFRRVKETDLINRDYFVIGKYLGGKYPPSTLIALNAAGIIPYESGLRTIDMLGLNDVHIAHRPFTDFEGVSGHQKHDADYVLSKRPDLILTGLPMLETEMLSPGQVQRRVAWWSSLLPGDARLHESDIFRNEYKLEALSMNDGRWLYCYVRKQDKEHHEAGQNI